MQKSTATAIIQRWIPKAAERKVKTTEYANPWDEDGGQVKGEFKGEEEATRKGQGPVYLV